MYVMYSSIVMALMLMRAVSAVGGGEVRMRPGLLKLEHYEKTSASHGRGSPAIKGGQIILASCIVLLAEQIEARTDI
jgi:hypothetical protein